VWLPYLATQFAFVGAVSNSQESDGIEKYENGGVPVFSTQAVTYY